MSSAHLLVLHGVTRFFGGLRAVNDVSLSIQAGEIVGLIGPNGAGKTTLVNLITGIYAPTAGEIIFEGARVSTLPAHLVARRGIARTFQIIQPFPRMTVLDNVAAGALFAGGCRNLAEARARAREHLAFTGLLAFEDQVASALPLARRKRLELAKSLAMRPRLLLLDEVNAGLNASEIDDALRLIGSLATSGISIIIIEHLMKVVSTACQRVVVMHQGGVIADAAPATVLRDRTVVEAYLGPRFAARAAGLSQ